MLQLEKLSYYQHLSLSGGQERPIYCSRIVDIRGSRYHVLSRILDTELDFTGRTNFLAHHLIFTPEEVRQFPSPPVILRGWTAWVKSWSKEPLLLENEDWSGLARLSSSVSVPATTWHQLTGDAINAYGLLELRAGIAFRVDSLTDEQVLALFAESLELLELRDPRLDFRATAWQYTFTTSMQEQDNPGDFRWRCLHSDNPASNRFAGPDCRALSDVRSVRVTSEEVIFARSGRQPPRFVIQPQNVRITEGETARLHAKAEGVPSPSYQWFTVDRAANGQVIANGTGAELVLQNPPFGLSRYVVRASNSLGEVTSEVTTVSVEQKVRLSRSLPDSGVHDQAKPSSPSYLKSADDIEKQRKRLETERAERIFRRRLHRNKVLVTILAILLVAVVGALVVHKLAPNKLPQKAISNEPARASQYLAETNETSDGKLEGARSAKQPLAGEGGPDKPAKLPPAWASRQIGTLGVQTSARTNNAGAFELAGAGTNIYQTNDNFFFVSLPVTNSVEFSAHLQLVVSESTSNVCGIMMRASENRDAAFAFIGASSTNILFVTRPATGKPCTNIYETFAGGAVFLKLIRDGNRFSGAFSVSTNTPKQIGETKEIPISAPGYLVGFAVCSGHTNMLAIAKFDGVTISPKAKLKN
jgi:hypothetical protein